MLLIYSRLSVSILVFRLKQSEYLRLVILQRFASYPSRKNIQENVPKLKTTISELPG